VATSSSFAIIKGKAVALPVGQWEKWAVPGPISSAIYDAKGFLLVFFEENTGDISCAWSPDNGQTFYCHYSIIRIKQTESVSRPYAIYDMKTDMIFLFYILNDNYLMMKPFQAGLLRVEDTYKRAKRFVNFNEKTPLDEGLEAFTAEGRKVRASYSVVIDGDATEKDEAYVPGQDPPDLQNDELWEEISVINPKRIKKKKSLRYILGKSYIPSDSSALTGENALNWTSGGTNWTDLSSMVDGTNTSATNKTEYDYEEVKKKYTQNWSDVSFSAYINNKRVIRVWYVISELVVGVKSTFNIINWRDTVEGLYYDGKCDVDLMKSMYAKNTFFGGPEDIYDDTILTTDYYYGDYVGPDNVDQEIVDKCIKQIQTIYNERSGDLVVITVVDKGIYGKVIHDAMLDMVEKDNEGNGVAFANIDSSLQKALTLKDQKFIAGKNSGKISSYSSPVGTSQYLKTKLPDVRVVESIQPSGYFDNKGFCKVFYMGDMKKSKSTGKGTNFDIEDKGRGSDTKKFYRTRPYGITFATLRMPDLTPIRVNGNEIA